MSPELPTISGTVNTNRYNDVPRTRRDLHRKAPIRPATAAATAVPWTRIKRNMTPAFVSVVPPPLRQPGGKGLPPGVSAKKKHGSKKFRTSCPADNSPNTNKGVAPSSPKMQDIKRNAMTL